jgi:hypothetical protein
VSKQFQVRSGKEAGVPEADVKTAVRSAIDFMYQVRQGNPPEDVAVEEVDLSENGLEWVITLGYYPGGTSMKRFSGEASDRQFRVFRVSRATGEVLSMKMREI